MRLNDLASLIKHKTGTEPGCIISGGVVINVGEHMGSLLIDLPGTWCKDCTVDMYDPAPLGAESEEDDAEHSDDGPSDRHKPLDLTEPRLVEEHCADDNVTERPPPSTTTP